MCLLAQAALHPSGSTRVIEPIVEENPQVLWRMDYYAHVDAIDELPIEMQNWMCAPLTLLGPVVTRLL